MAAPTVSGVSTWRSFNDAGQSLTSITTTAITTSVGRAVLATVTGQYNVTGSAPDVIITDSLGNAWTRIGTDFVTTQFGGNPVFIDCFVCLEAASAGVGHTFHAASGDGNTLMTTFQVVELDQAVEFDTTTTQIPNTLPWDAALTTGAPDCFVYGAFLPTLSGGGTSWTEVSAGFTSINAGDSAVDWPLSILYKSVASSGPNETLSITGSDNVDSENIPVRMVSLKAIGGGGDVTVGVTGVESVSAPGTVGVAQEVSATGVSAAGAVGDVTFISNDVVVAITGVATTGSVGNVVASGGDTSSGANALRRYWQQVQIDHLQELERKKQRQRESAEESAPRPRKQRKQPLSRKKSEPVEQHISVAPALIIPSSPDFTAKNAAIIAAANTQFAQIQAALSEVRVSAMEADDEETMLLLASLE